MNKLQVPVSSRRGWFQTRPLTIVLAVAMSVAIVASPVAAAKPTHTEFTFSFINYAVTDLCAFPIYQDGTVNINQTDFVDKGGVLTRSDQHVVQQDTFHANGKILVGFPYTFNARILFDSSGNMTNFFIDGVLEKIRLPDGSLFVGAGRADFLDHPGVTILLSPDHGNPGNVAGFCAALAP